MAATNKCLAQSNKSRHVSRATKGVYSYQRRMALVTLSRNVSKMSRAALLGCTLALLFSVGAGHAQHENCQSPVQKLPASPPVACVTTQWCSEPWECSISPGWGAANV